MTIFTRSCDPNPFYAAVSESAHGARCRCLSVAVESANPNRRAVSETTFSGRLSERLSGLQQGCELRFTGSASPVVGSGVARCVYGYGTCTEHYLSNLVSFEMCPNSGLSHWHWCIGVLV